MSYRDDETARAARMEALERQAARADALERRVAELEAEVARLRARQPEAPPAPPTPASPRDATFEEMYVDPKMREFADRLLAASRAPERDKFADLASNIVSGVGSSRVDAVIAGAEDCARAAGRVYVTPIDIKTAVAPILRAHIISSSDATVTVDALVQRILDLVEVP